MKRTKEITIIHYRRQRVKKRRAASAEGCPVCGDGSDLITVATAVRLTGLSPDILYDGVTRHHVHAIQTLNGQLLICPRSLMEFLEGGFQ